MSYTRLTWVESETPLSAQNMNNIEDGIEELQAQKVDKTSGKGLSTNDYTTEEKTKLAGIAAGAEVNVQSDWSQSDSSADDYIKNKPGEATTSAAGLMSAADKTKLDGIATGAEVNQNAFSNVKVGSTTVAADGKTDTLELVAGSNVTLTPDATNDKVTIAATVKAKTLTISGTVTIPADSFVTGAVIFVSEDLVGKTIIGYRNLTLYNSADGSAKVVPCGMSVASETQGGVATKAGISLRIYNPSNESVTIKNTSKCTLIYVD